MKHKDVLHLALTLLVVGIFWFVMFSPWTAPKIDFWVGITTAAAVVLTLTTLFFPEWRQHARVSVVGTLCGVLLAAALWGVFWLGDKISAWLMPFTVPQVDHIYTLKDDCNFWLVGLALLLIVGPAEEIFWRGYLQQKASEWWGRHIGFLVMLCFYTAIHVWSFNFMLIAAAAVAGGFQGLVYWQFGPRSLWPLIVSHALWDVAVFLVFPI